MNENININGYVTVKQEDEVLVDKAKNKFTENMIKGLIGCYSKKNIYFDSRSDIWAEDMSIRLGYGGLTETFKTMTQLNDVYDTTQNEINFYGIETGDWYSKVKFTVTYNTENLQNNNITDVNELGLRMRPITQHWANPDGSVTTSADLTLCARICEGDLSMTPFTVNQSKPLTIEWEYELVIV